ncbi:MAG: hypothetical protein LIO92_09015 [Clostridiales bacterium]|nr:hypothetical protein [Clostridiales bacterium]
MPYCPKCDMEFVQGITICSDCGGPLYESKEEAEAAMKKEWMDQQAQTEALRELSRQISEEQQEENPQEENPEDSQSSYRHVYVSKSQQYDDYQSSAAAFYLVGGILLAVSVLGLAGILPLPFYGLSRYISLGAMAAIGLACLFWAVQSSRTARTVQGQISQEEETTKALIDWFLSSYTADGLDQQILSETPGELTPEEQSLKRFSLIQDLIITNHDIIDQSYVDLLSEEIYDKMFEN